MIAAQDEVASVRAKRDSVVSLRVWLLSESFRRHFDTERKVFTSNWQIGIVNRAFDPNPRAMRSVVNELRSERRNNCQLEYRNDKSFIESFHAAAALTFATSFRLMRSSAQPSSKNSSPNPIRLAE